MNKEFLLDILCEQGYKKTPAREAIIKIISKKKNGVFSIKDLVEALATFDQATIYRTVALFEQLDIVHKTAVIDGQQHYELHGNSQTHHHHIMCTGCNKKSCVKCTVKKEKITGFRKIHHTTSFTGLCVSCSQYIS